MATHKNNEWKWEVIRKFARVREGKKRNFFNCEWMSFSLTSSLISFQHVLLFFPFPVSHIFTFAFHPSTAAGWKIQQVEQFFLSFLRCLLQCARFSSLFQFSRETEWKSGICDEMIVCCCFLFGCCVVSLMEIYSWILTLSLCVQLSQLNVFVMCWSTLECWKSAT